MKLITLAILASLSAPVFADEPPPDNRLVPVRCEEYGKIAEEMTQLIFRTDAKTILQIEAKRYPKSQAYHVTILRMVLEPPIQNGAEFHRELTTKCIESQTQGS